MPSILVEAGFISNKEEEEYLKSDEGQKEIVDDITAALKNYSAVLSTPPPLSTETSFNNNELFNNKVGSSLAFFQSIALKEKNTVFK